jgi:hypothetical protein
MIEHRWTTDILFLLAILFMWAAMSGVGGNAVQKGNPYRLIAPTDSSGSNCGISESVKHKKYFYTIMSTGVGICVDGCPQDEPALTSSDSANYKCLPWVGRQLHYFI